MAREKQDYRANLEEIRTAFPNKAVLNMKEVTGFLRRDRRTLLKDRTFPAQLIGGKYAVTITGLARYMS